MNCREWYECMPPEQWAILTAAIVSLVVTLIGSVGLFVKWLFGYIARVKEENLQDMRQERELEKGEATAKQEALRIEQEIKLRELEARHEAFEKSLMVIAQFSERHAQADERHADNQNRQIETYNRLAAAIETQTSALTHSQSWQEKRSEDYLETVDKISERAANMERTGNETLSKVDLLASGLEEVKTRLDQVLTATQQNPNKAALEQIEKTVNELLSLAKAPPPKIAEVVVTPAVSDDTLPLDEETLKTVNEEKKDSAA